jgi:multidrug efflux pump subunit AcrA (membrane-fusion protein)
MKRNIFLALVGVLVVIGVLAGVKGWQINTLVAAARSAAPPAETIASAVAHEEKWPDTLTAVGSISAKQGVTLSPEIAGTVRKRRWTWRCSTPNAPDSCAPTIRCRKPNWTRRRRC